MEKIKKIVMYIAGPVVIGVELLALFVHLFTSANTKPWMIGGVIIFFAVFVPLFSMEYFKQSFKKPDKKAMQFKKRNTRMEWKGGNIHGKNPVKVERPGKFFKKTT